jgi:hypothetical protein
VTTEINCNWKTLLAHVLVVEPAAAWQSLLAIAHVVCEACVIEQIMPRSLLRTRLISHVYGKRGLPRVCCLTQRMRALRNCIARYGGLCVGGAVRPQGHEYKAQVHNGCGRPAGTLLYFAALLKESNPGT